MSILAWWAIPIGAVVIAAAVSGLIHRVRRLSDDETIAAYSRFRDAISNDRPPVGAAEAAAGGFADGIIDGTSGSNTGSA